MMGIVHHSYNIQPYLGNGFPLWWKLRMMGIVHGYTAMGKASFHENNCHKAHSTHHLTNVDGLQSI